MKVAIHQPHYLPWLGYLAKWAAADVFVVLDTVQYEKNGWQNRNRIKTPAGAAWLTVPVHAPLGTAISAATIAAEPWARHHMAAIQHAYARAPHYRRYRDELEAWYAAPAERFAAVAEASAGWLAERFEIGVPTRRASELGVTDTDPTGRLLAICRVLGADTYLAGRDGVTYMDLARFEAVGIAVRVQRYDHPVYPQLHGDFVPFLSSLDLLLNAGPAGRALLEARNAWDEPPGHGKIS